MNPVEYAICEIQRHQEAVGLGFAVAARQVLTCAHVVNTGLGRDQRDPTDPGEVELSLTFPIGAPPGAGADRRAVVTEWLPTGEADFDQTDLALLTLTEPVPAHVPVPTCGRQRPPMPVQLWGPQPRRPDGGHVRGEVLGEVKGGQIQINVDGGQFRVRPGFSGGPVWRPGTPEVVGVLVACGHESDAVDAYLLGVDRIGLVAPEWAGGGSALDLAGGEPDLLARVAAAVPYVPDLADAQVRRTRRGGLAHLLVTRRVRVGSREFRVDHPIAVHAGEPVPADVDRVRQLLRHYRDAGFDITEATLVHTGPPAPAALGEPAAQSGVRLSTLAEFQLGVDLPQFAARQRERLAADTRYPAGGYVRQRFREPPATEVRPEALRERLLSWLADPDGHLVVVLAPFGHGKTYLLHELAREMSARPDYPAVPVLVRLAELERSHQVDELVGTELQRAGHRRIDLDRLAYLRREGRIALLLDGFDELARRVSYDQAAAHLAEIVRAAEGRAKVVLTSRREFFLSDRDTEVAFAQRLGAGSGRRLVTITDFDPPQMHEFLAVRLGPAGATRWVRLLTSAGLIGLAANPRMLNLLITVDEERLRAASVAGNATRAWVFEEVLREWLTGEFERAHPYGTRPEPWVTAMRTALSTLAERMWVGGLPHLTVADLAAVAEPLVAVPGADRLTVPQAVHLLGSGTLLVRVGDDAFDFPHRSLMEFLVAEALAARITDAAPAGWEPLLRHPLGPLQIDLLDELAGRAAVTGWVREAVTRPGEAIRGNAVGIAQRLGIALPQRLVLRSQDLRGQDLTGRDLTGADLGDADLTDALLDGADLTGADLTGATLRRARLDRAILTGAVVEGADLSQARLLGADLRGVSWGRVGDARRATLLAARLDDAAAAALSAAGATGPEVRPELQIGPGGRLGPVAAAPTGDYLAVAAGSTVQIWHLPTGTQLRTLRFHTRRVRGLAWSPDGRRLATTATDRIVIWDAAADRVEVLTEPDEPVFDGVFEVIGSGGAGAVGWSPDGRRLATACATFVRIWDAATGTQERVLIGHRGAVTALAWHPDSGQLATGATDGTARTWRAWTGNHGLTLPGHPEGVSAVTWSPDGGWLATACGDRWVRIWNASTGVQDRAVTDPAAGVSQVAWSADGRLATAGDEEVVRIWDAATGEHQRDLDTGDTSVVVWLPGARLASGGSGGMTVWEADTGRRVVELATGGRLVLSVGWSADGRRLAAAARDGTVRIWDRASGFQVNSVDGHEGPVTAVAWSPGGRPLTWAAAGRLLATGGVDGTARIWEPTTGEQRQSLDSGGEPVLAVAWSPDGSRLATADADGTARIWSTTTGARLDTLSGHTDRIEGLAWSPDGRRLATGSGDTTVRIWDAATGMRLATLSLPGHRKARIRSVAWSPGGRHLALAADTSDVHILEVATGALWRTLSGHTEWVRDLAWSPDGHRLASAGWDHTVRVWDLAAGEPASRVLTGHTDWVHAVAWSPEGRYLASVGWDGTVRLWDAGTGAEVAMLLPLADGVAVLYPDGRYKVDGTVHGELWWAIGQSRFALDELAGFDPQTAPADPATPLLGPT